MRRISLDLSDEELILIEAAGSPNRNAFIVAAATSAAVSRLRRPIEDIEIEAAVRATADDEAEFAS
jgi:hypothetical protein